MKFALFCTSFLAFLGLSSLEAQQQQSGSVAIAGAITPSMETATVSEFTGCVEKLVAAEMLGNEAVKACTKIAEIAANTTTRLANEAADATKASRPIIIMSRYGNNRGGYRYGGGSSGRVVVSAADRTERTVALIKARTERTVAMQQARAERAEAARKARADRTEKK